MSRRRQRERAEKTKADDEASKNTGQTPCEKQPAQTFDEYQCSGNVEIDFPALCALLNVKDIPAVYAKPTAASSAETEGGNTGVLLEPIPTTTMKENAKLQIKTAPFWSKPCLHVELESEDPLSAKKLMVPGWNVNEQIARVLEKMLLSLSKLQSLQFWQAGLTDPTIVSLINTVSLCSTIRAVTLEGNPLPEHSYVLLLSEDSALAHLSLRNNWIGDEGARLIGLALSNIKSANKNLLSLNLAFNSIGDAGAAHIAQGLRLNRALLCLSLSNNQIGDSGAARLAEILGPFALTHEEIMERRKLLLERMQSSTFKADSDHSLASQLSSMPSSSSLNSKGTNKGKKKEVTKKDQKPAAGKENLKSNKKTSEPKVAQSRGSRHGSKERQEPAQEEKSMPIEAELVELVEVVNPLLDQWVQRRNGELLLPGNKTLISLNLSGNRIREKSLPLFLSSLERQGERGGLLRLCLQRNRFPAECESHQKINNLMRLKRSTQHKE